MQRKKFLKNLVISATSLPLIVTDLYSGDPTKKKSSDTTPCGDKLTPAVGEGPYYIDEKLNRSHIAETKTGIPLTLMFTVEDINCKPIQGAVVDVWHCDKDGVYSDAKAQGTTSQKWLRGYQATDANGKCTFQTIFPGWYNGRLTHIHGKVKVGTVTKQTTNFFIPKEIEQAAFATPHYRKGQNPTTVEQDLELRGDKKSYEELMMHVTGDTKNGYIAKFTIVFA